MKIGGGVAEHSRQSCEMRNDRVEDRDRVRDDEDEKDRHEDVHRLLHAAQIENDEDDDQREFGGKFVRRPMQRKKRPDLIACAGDGDGDRQYVVDEQRASGDDADAIAEEFRRDEVSAAAAGKMMDDVGVGDRDRDRGHGHENDREVIVRAERLVRLFRSVRR